MNIMKKIIILLVITVFIVQYANAVSKRYRRQLALGNESADMKTMISSVMNMLQEIPFLGGWILWIEEYITKIITVIQTLVNGEVGRLLGGALPCVITEKQEMRCNGITSATELSSLLYQLMELLPISGITQSTIYFLVKTFIDPIIDAAFGGLPINS